MNNRIQTWLHDYDKIQSFAVILIHIQIGCALIGSLGALYNGVSLINLGIALFALISIESGNQNLSRTYVFLLFSAILLDILWFILFSHEIWHISTEIYGKFARLSMKLTLLMQIVGLIVRSSSTLLWIRMYRMRASCVDNTYSSDGALESGNSFINPSTPPVDRHTPCSDDGFGSAIYDQPCYSTLFSDDQNEESLHKENNARNKQTSF